MSQQANAFDSGALRASRRRSTFVRAIHNPRSTTMKNIAILVAGLTCTHAFAHVGPIEEVDLPETTVIAVKATSSNPSAYAEAFGKLVGYYAQPNAGVKVVFPQRSIIINGASYAAVAIGAPVTPPPGIDLLTLPQCHFLSASYTGNYDGIRPAIDSVVNKGLGQRRQVNEA